MELKVNIYVLIDPISLKIRYIGVTRKYLKDRLNAHIYEAKFNPLPLCREG